VSTINQLSSKVGSSIKRNKKIKKNKTYALKGAPHRLGCVYRLYKQTPKKPNSAKRNIAKIILNFNKRFVLCQVPGESPTLQKFNNVLIRGARLRDLPGIRYKAISGKLDFEPNTKRKQRRSKFGVVRLKI
jgi:small subunit ribosomal protein S12